MGASRVVIVQLGGAYLSVPLAAALEVLVSRPLTRYAAAPPFVAGITNVRGTVVTVIDLGLRLGRPSSNRPDGSILLVSHRGRPVGLAVDAVVDICDAPSDSSLNDGSDVHNARAARAEPLDIARLLSATIDDDAAPVPSEES